MAINFGLANPGGGFDYLESLQALGNAAQQRQGMEQRSYAFDQARRQDAARPMIQQQAAGGDFTGAAAQAFSLGDYDALKYVGGLESAKRAQLAQEADTIGRLATSLKGVPANQRAATFAALAPRLKRMGFDDGELAAVNLTDEGLDAYMALATDTKTALANYAKSQEPTVLADGSQLWQNGQMVGENPRDPRWQFDSESGSWLQEPGSGAAGTVPQTAGPGGADPSGTFNRMIGAESGGRQFGANGAPLTSPKGATGIAQVMPGTGPEAARAAGLPWDEQRYRNDPAYNRAIGEAYYAMQLARFGGDPEAAAAAYNAGPGRVRAPRTQGDWRSSLPAETRDYIRKVAPGFAGGRRGDGPSQLAQPGVVNVRPAKAKSGNAPSGYRFSGDRLEPIPGGPADPATATSRNVQSNRKAEGDLRSKFDSLPEVKTFKQARQQFNTLRDLASKPNPNGSDDLAIIFNFMKTLDPQSVVREGEFMQAANSAGFVEAMGNRYKRARDGTWLNTDQRKDMVRTAYQNYANYRDAYNQTAENYRGYARDYGVSADRVARTYTPDKPKSNATPPGLRITGITRGPRK